MGYTITWSFTKNPKDIKAGEEKFAKSVELLKKCVKNTDCKLANWTGKGRPKFNNDSVCFNGTEDDSYDSFEILLDDKKYYDFRFCKTMHKPYTLAVWLAVFSFKKYFGKNFKYDADFFDTPEFEYAKHIFKATCNNK